MNDDNAALLLALAAENDELRAVLAEAQDLLIETAVDAGELHARIEELQAEVEALRIASARPPRHLEREMQHRTEHE